MKGYDMYQRPSFEELQEMGKNLRAGEFAQELHTKLTFDENGGLIERDSWSVVEQVRPYIEEQEALFQQELAARNATINKLEPPTL